jgi:AcrR family transcriptional regulator
MGIKERRERERSETRERILDAARELFASTGYEGVGMREIAAKIEYSPTAIYAHFANKEELFHEICYADFRKLAHSFRDIAATPDPLDRIRRAGEAYIEFGINHPNHYRLMFMTHHPFDKSACPCDLPEKGNPEEDAYAFIKLAVADAIRAGVFREEINDVELLAQTLWAAVHGIVALEISRRNDHWVDWRPIKLRARFMLDSLLPALLKSKE